MAKCAFNLQFVIILSAFLFASSNCWLKCKDTFCGRIREKPVIPKNIELDFGRTLQLKDTGVEGKLNIRGQSSVKFQLTVVQDSTFRFFIDELSSPRYRPSDVLVRNFEPLSVKPVKTNNSLITVKHGNAKALIYKSPFKVEFYNNDSLVSVANWNNRLIFEAQTHDKTAVALDILFPYAEQAYGIPLHADHLALRSTVVNKSEPYRLYNLGYGNYTVNSTEALHGSVPVLYAHNTTQSSGVFWLNSAQTWVDVATAPDQIDAYFMSETGALEIFVFVGPTLPQAVVQYSKLTGVAPLPQYFALGYHQSRYSWSQYDVYYATTNFLLAHMPLDSIWLDYEHTDNKRYFYWDPIRFPNPFTLLYQLNQYNKKLVTLVNPHFKNDDNYFIDKQAKLKHYYVKKPTGEDYSEQCLPGLSSWLDFLNPDARNFYANQYSIRNAFSHRHLHIWNDMNEPTVFTKNESLEKTLPPDLIHHNGITHRKVHNIYGFYQTMATLEGLLNSKPYVRPFILTRSHFAGSQRYATVWTGENYASWEHLRISLPMCLNEALAGISFCGADVGGFNGIPDDELYIRWYQAGAWLPFYRGNYAFDVPQREPISYPKSIQDKIRSTLRLRYAHIPFWYLLFRQHEITGEPVIRPLTYHYPGEKETLQIDDEILVGPNVLAAPVLEPGVESKKVYLPGGKTQIWYNIDDNYTIYYGSGYQTISVNLDSMPVFYRGGSIIPRKDRPQNSTVYMRWDDYALYISPDSNGDAHGSLYDDDCTSFDYKANKYMHVNFTFSKNVLTSKVDKTGLYPNPGRIEKLVILNPAGGFDEAKYTSGKEVVTTNDVKYHHGERILEVTFRYSLTIRIQNEFKVELQKSDSLSSAVIITKLTTSVKVFLFAMISRMLTRV